MVLRRPGVPNGRVCNALACRGGGSAPPWRAEWVVLHRPGLQNGWFCIALHHPGAQRGRLCTELASTAGSGGSALLWPAERVVLHGPGRQNGRAIRAVLQRPGAHNGWFCAALAERLVLHRACRPGGSAPLTTHLIFALACRTGGSAPPWRAKWVVLHRPGVQHGWLCTTPRVERDFLHRLSWRAERMVLHLPDVQKGASPPWRPGVQNGWYHTALACSCAGNKRARRAHFLRTVFLAVLGLHWEVWLQNTRKKHLETNASNFQEIVGFVFYFSETFWRHFEAVGGRNLLKVNESSHKANASAIGNSLSARHGRMNEPLYLFVMPPMAILL